MSSAARINELLQKHQQEFAPVVDFNPSDDKLVQLDFTASNTDLTIDIFGDTEKFETYVNDLLRHAEAKYGIGGYFENRTVYERSTHFDNANEEPRRLHLGVDIWGKMHTPVYAFMDGIIHGFAFNNRFGDYGSTIILKHQLEDDEFYSLYGHLSLKSLESLKKGSVVKKNELIGKFGDVTENGGWPAHLHFQLMCETGEVEGDYPGVAKFSDYDLWVHKIPDPNIILEKNFLHLLA